MTQATIISTSDNVTEKKIVGKEQSTSQIQARNKQDAVKATEEKTRQSTASNTSSTLTSSTLTSSTLNSNTITASANTSTTTEKTPTKSDSQAQAVRSGSESKVADLKSDKKNVPLTLSQARDLVKVTVEKLASAGTEFVQNTKVLHNLKNKLPTVHSQLNLQVQQEHRQLTSQIASQVNNVSAQTMDKWFDGQVVKATVVSNSEQVPGKPDLRQVTVAINREQLTLTYPASANLDLKAGQQLALVVEKTNDRFDVIKQTVQELSQLSKSMQQLNQSNTIQNNAMQGTLIQNTEKQNAEKVISKAPETKNEQVPVSVKDAGNIQDIKFVLRLSPEQSQKLSQAEAKLTNTNQPLSKLMSSVDTIYQHLQKPSVQQNYPKAFIDAVNTLVSDFMKQKEISTKEGVLNAVKSSGLFLEKEVKFELPKETIQNNTQKLESITKTLKSIEALAKTLAQTSPQKIDIAPTVANQFNHLVSQIVTSSEQGASSQLALSQLNQQSTIKIEILSQLSQLIEPKQLSNQSVLSNKQMESMISQVSDTLKQLSLNSKGVQNPSIQATNSVNAIKVLQQFAIEVERTPVLSKEQIVKIQELSQKVVTSIKENLANLPQPNDKILLDTVKAISKELDKPIPATQNEAKQQLQRVVQVLTQMADRSNSSITSQQSTTVVNQQIFNQVIKDISDLKLPLINEKLDLKLENTNKQNTPPPVSLEKLKMIVQSQAITSSVSDAIKSLDSLVKDPVIKQFTQSPNTDRAIKVLQQFASELERTTVLPKTQLLKVQELTQNLLTAVKESLPNIPLSILSQSNDKALVDATKALAQELEKPAPANQNEAKQQLQRVAQVLSQMADKQNFSIPAQQLSSAIIQQTQQRLIQTEKETTALKLPVINEKQAIPEKVINQILYEALSNNKADKKVQSSLLRLLQMSINSGLDGAQNKLQWFSQVHISPLNQNDSQTLLQKMHTVLSQSLQQLSSNPELMPKLLAPMQNVLAQYQQQFKDIQTQQTSNVPQALQAAQQQFNQQIAQLQQNMTQFQAQLQAQQTTPTMDLHRQGMMDLRVNIHRLLTVLENMPILKLPNTLEQLTKSESTLNPAFKDQELPSKTKHAQVQKSPLGFIPPVSPFPVFQQQLMEQLENSLNRMMATQINTREQGEQQNTISLELPIRLLDKTQILQMKFKAQKKQHKKEEKIWTANLAFELPSLGEIRIYITLDYNDVAIQFWLEQDSSKSIIQENFSLLSERLLEAGYSISQLQAFHGIPGDAQESGSEAGSETSTTDKASDSLVDLHV
ncbi:MAG: flagellar hook-length control protein FliK [Gammaproteobacteria bacterium]|nr:flagellar hook-length control protein FliK [Gammaproteobacteria bacterium]